MKLKDLIDGWQRDCKIDASDLTKESQRIFDLHGKYLDLLTMERMRLKVLQNKLAILKLDKHKFLIEGGTVETREKGWIYPTSGKILRTDVDIYMGADSHYQEMDLQVQACQVIVDALVSIMFSIKDRTSVINGMIQRERFTAGV